MITRRLSNKLSRYPVLNENNHVALPHTSTELPIATIMHCLEDATVNRKELWLLSQDISKAYDSISIDLLKKALERIKIPNGIVNIIVNTLTGRENAVITNLGKTKRYRVEDGIDQGEPMAPLL